MCNNGDKTSLALGLDIFNSCVFLRFFYVNNSIPYVNHTHERISIPILLTLLFPYAEKSDKVTLFGWFGY